MVNQEILQGLKFALSKKESLQSAMQSFYNAGYEKKEIEEAARALQLEMYQAQYAQQLSQQSSQAQPQSQPQPTSPQKSEYKPLETSPKAEQTQKPVQVQKISNYDREQKDTVTIVLIIILILLLMTLVGVFIFKQKIVEFLNNLF